MLNQEKQINREHFCRGFSSVVVLQPYLHRHSLRADLFLRDDLAAIRSDWGWVGQDLSNAMLDSARDVPQDCSFNAKMIAELNAIVRAFLAKAHCHYAQKTCMDSSAERAQERTDLVAK